MSSCGSVTYGVAKELAKILKPLVDKSPHHVNNTQDFVEEAKHVTWHLGNASALMMCLPCSPQSL